MKIFTHTATLSDWLMAQRNAGKSVGFVPTMGGLHAGHLSLIEASKEKDDLTVASIFVNPSQFDDAEDLQRYPRNHGIDLTMLNEANCQIVFLPSVMEVYPPEMDTTVDVDMEGLDAELEGKFRPGHFDGMIEVVHRLLQIVQPNRLYMGQKDFQQKTLVQHMIDQLHLGIELVVEPIVREDDGLAMSSRNARLTPEYRSKAVEIHKTLTSLAKERNQKSIEELTSEAFRKLEEIGLNPEYVAICDSQNLKPLTNWSDSNQPVALAAAWAGEVRLIDNIIL